MVKMTNLVKNKILETVQNSDGITDKDLLKNISKIQPILENEFNKILLDLEIKGLISVSWLTKDIKRIEYVTIKTEDDEYDKQIKETENKDYEASFPNAD
jgi:transcription initiation factor IIE alpha subunit